LDAAWRATQDNFIACGNEQTAAVVPQIGFCSSEKNVQCFHHTPSGTGMFYYFCFLSAAAFLFRLWKLFFFKPSITTANFVDIMRQA